MPTTQEEFEQEFHSFRRGSLIFGAIATIAFAGLMYALSPLAPILQNFFRNRIGGVLGEFLLGISIPLMASPPIFAFLFWGWRRTHRPQLKCPLCSYSFASNARFQHVRKTGKCPRCIGTSFEDLD